MLVIGHIANFFCRRCIVIKIETGKLFCCRPVVVNQQMSQGSSIPCAHCSNPILCRNMPRHLREVHSEDSSLRNSVPVRFCGNLQLTASSLDTQSSNTSSHHAGPDSRVDSADMFDPAGERRRRTARRHCRVCGVSVLSKNFARHLRTVCGFQVTARNVGRRRECPSLELQNVPLDSGTRPQMTSSSRDAPRSSTPPQRSIPDSSNESANVFSTAGEIPSYIYSRAAKSLLDQHPHYTESGLTRYLADRHPEIPAEHRRALIIGAVTGAQLAAQHHIIVECNKSSHNPVYRRRAENAGCKLSYWNYGLRREDDNMLPPFPMISVFDDDDRSVGPSDQQLPVSLESAHQD